MLVEGGRVVVGGGGAVVDCGAGGGAVSPVVLDFELLLNERVESGGRGVRHDAALEIFGVGRNWGLG